MIWSIAMSDTAERRNWADNYTYQAHEITEPTSIADIQQVAEKSQHTSAVGSRHSFNAIADTEGTLVSLHTFNRVLDLDTEAMTVTVEAGMTYGQLASFLSEKEYALHNLASLPHISVVGACMTGTHGSGETNGNLATAVCGLEFITADGQVVRRTQDEHPDEFAGLVVGLGAYGIVTAITLRILPQYQMRQNVYLDLPFSEALAQFDEIQASGYSVSLFTRWQASHFEQLWVKQIVDETTSNQAPPELFGAVAARDNVHPLIDLSAESCTEQLGIVGDWQDRLPHFRMDHTPSHGMNFSRNTLFPGNTQQRH
jgi:xylitol oxidase